MHAQKSSLFVHAPPPPSVHRCSNRRMTIRKTGSPAALSAARWLEALMKRHGLEMDNKGFTEVARRTELRGEPVDRITVMRIAQANAKTAPQIIKLQRIARAFGESYVPGAEGRLVGYVEVQPDGTYAFRLNEGVIPTPDLLRATKRAIDAVPEEQRAETKAIKDSSKARRRKLDEEE